jgi:purine-cytosine permease-like protein
MTAYTPNTPQWRRFLSLPKTRLGWWSVGLAATFVVLLIFGYNVLSLYGIVLLFSGLCSGVLGLFAVLRGHERSVLVWLAMLPGLFALAFLIGEFLGRW